jgi:hypothetical protein
VIFLMCDLVYALLHRRDMFQQYADHDLFAHLIENIEAVVVFFQDRLEGLSGNGDLPSTVQVLDAIEVASKSWMGGGLMALPKVKFEYTHEDVEAGHFFLGFTWNCISSVSLIYWGEEVKGMWETCIQDDLDYYLDDS